MLKYLTSLTMLMCVIPQAATAADVDFTRDIRPILSGRCFKCHGPDEETREGGLRLDTQSGAFSEADSGDRGIVPGHANQSSVIERVTSTDEDLRMPPLSEGPALSPKEVDVLKKWIQSGAKYSAHWSFVKPQKTRLPQVSDSDWCRTDIDFFVMARLDREGLAPSPEADRYTLARRLHIDLIGLPPEIADVDAFMADQSPDAYEKMVDRLLASPAFGERWGRVWLDLARYADTAGYADDPPRVIWRYRDWVIRAMNENVPFDEFTKDQIAGDLRDGTHNDRLIATAFHRNTMTNSEGGTDDEEFRSAAIVDRVNTTLQTWMGLTMACAQCHTHKYDPITQEDYFRVYAILNQTADADRRDESPTLSELLPEQVQQREQIHLRIDELKREQSKLLEESPQPTVPVGDSEIRARFVRIELPKGKKQFLSLAEVQAFVGKNNIAVDGKATQISTYSDGPAHLAIDGNTNGHYFDAKSTTHTALEENAWWEVDLGNDHALEKVVIWNRNDSASIGRRLDGFTILLLDADRNPVWAHQVSKAPDKSADYTVPKVASQVSKGDLKTLARYLQKMSPELDKLATEIERQEKKLAAIKPVRTPVLRELPKDKQRKTFIQLRGNFLDLGKEVSAGFPEEFAMGYETIESNRPDRLELARWLVDAQNPLTARVIVNRHWEQLFGIGLVDTSEDFGLQGSLPSHPQLLDRLAYKFQHGNGSSGQWNVKGLIRSIVLSSTYRQSSKVDDELAKQDPLNRLMARGPRYRLSAERIRDQALAAGDLLSRKMGGPSVKPPRPNLGLRAAFGGSTDWTVSSGEDKYRRGVYTYWQRTIPYPSMDTFDAPSREVCTVRRIRTNTPLQALVTMNDPVFVEAAKGVAKRTLAAKESNIDRLIYAFRSCVCRPPSKTEISTLQKTLEAALKHYQSNPKDAEMLVGKDDLNRDDSVELAAWTLIGNVLLNLDETLARR